MFILDFQDRKILKSYDLFLDKNLCFALQNRLTISEHHNSSWVRVCHIAIYVLLVFFVFRSHCFCLGIVSLCLAMNLNVMLYISPDIFIVCVVFCTLTPLMLKHNNQWSRITPYSILLHMYDILLSSVWVSFIIHSIPNIYP